MTLNLSWLMTLRVNKFQVQNLRREVCVSMKTTQRQPVTQSKFTMFHQNTSKNIIIRAGREEKWVSQK